MAFMGLPIPGMIIGAYFVFIIALYVYSALALMTIANRTKTDNAWLAWIPIANVYLITQIAKTPWWTFFAIFLPIIPILGGLALLAVTAWWWWKIAERRHHPGWVGILMLVPVVNLIVMGVLAWGK